VFTTDLYAAFINLVDQRAIVVGAGEMAAEKIDSLRACGADVVPVMPDAYRAEVLDDALLVIAATSELDLAQRVFDDATERNMLVNVADVPALCNFILPAIARRGPVTIAVSTAGASPALAQRIRREMTAHFGDEYGTLARMLDDLRPWAKENLATYEARRDFFAGIVNGDPDPIELLRAGKRAEVEALIDRARAAVRGAG
jgi:siroheme synthase-like protein